MVADCLNSIGPTLLRPRLFRKGEGCKVLWPERFRCKAFPPVTILETWVRKRMDRMAKDSIGSAEAMNG